MKPYSILVLITVFAFTNCIPTSVLADIKDPTGVGQNNFKVKRSSDEKSTNSNVNQPKNSNTNQHNAPMSNSIPSSSVLNSPPNHNNYISNQIPSGNNGEKIQDGVGEIPHSISDPIMAGLFRNANGNSEKPVPHKRGVNSQFYSNYGLTDSDLSSNAGRSYPNYIPNGIWGNELDPITSMDFQDFDDYPRSQYSRSRIYDNLQNYLNNGEPTSSAQYQGPLALPYQYSDHFGYNKYLNDRKKRSNNKQRYNFDDQIQDYNDVELTPNELLALLAMIEAGALEKDSQSDPLWGLNTGEYQPLDKQNYYDDHEEVGSFMVPNKYDENDFDPRYQIPITFDNAPRYDIYKENKMHRVPQSKRFMVSKKKRSLNQYFTSPIGKPGISFSPIKGAKSIRKVI